MLDAAVLFLGHTTSDIETAAANKRVSGMRTQIVDCIKLGEIVTAKLTEAGGTVEIIVRPLTQTAAASSARSF